MTVEPNWRKTVPEVVEPYVHSDTSLIQRLVDSGSLTPDTRLQAIADAPRCVHGNIYTHIILTAIRTTTWCDGAPELAALLDALTKETE